MKNKAIKKKKSVRQLNKSSTVLLDYSQSITIPSPLQCSTATEERGKIVVKIDPKGKKIYCEKIFIYVPYDNNDNVGKANTVFYLDATSAISGDTNWGPARYSKTQGNMSGLDPNLNYLTFEINNNYGDLIVQKPFDITISGVINKVAGTPKVIIHELSDNTDNDDFSRKEHSFTVQKNATPILYLRNLMTVKPGSPLIPCTEFASDTEIQVDWDTNATDVKLYNKKKPVPLIKGKNSITIKEGIQTDTTLLLIATLSGKTLSASIHITVSSPALTPRSVVTSGDHVIKGNLRL
jgi:hypothetical protein